MINQDSTTRPAWRRNRAVGVLLILLLSLILWGGYLAITAPYLGATYRGVDIDGPHDRALLTQSSEHANSVCTWSSAVQLDLASGALSKPHDLRFGFLTHIDDNGNAQWLAELGDVGVCDFNHPRDMRIVITDLNTGRRLKSIPYRFEVDSYRLILLDRFIVTRRASALDVIDLATAQPTAVNFPTGNSLNRGIVALGDTRWFVSLSMTGTPVELYRIDDNAVIHHVATWPAMPLAAAGFASPGFSGGAIATINSSANQIEIRSIADGSLVRSQTLPADFDPVNMPWRASEDLLMYLDKTTLKIFNWQTGESLPSIQDSDQHWRQRGSLIVVRSQQGYHRRVIDVQTGETIGSFRAREGLNYFDRQRAIVSSADRGWTITEFDLATGKVSRSWQPYAYVCPSFVAWLIAFFVWSVLWVAASFRRGIFASTDVILIGGVAFSLLVLRVVIAGDTLDASRPGYQYAQGVAMAGASVLLLWLVFGRTRITLRLLPLIGFCGLTTGILVAVFRHQPSHSWYALASTFLPIAVLSVWLIMLRVLKWRIVVANAQQQTLEQMRYPLRDLFLITLLTSAGFAALSLISSDAGVLLDLNLMNWPLLVSQIVGMAAIVTALARHRWVVLPSAAIVLVAFILLAAEAYLSFQYERLQDIHPLIIRSPPERALITYPIALFAMLLPFRIRNWRLHFTR